MKNHKVNKAIKITILIFVFAGLLIVSCKSNQNSKKSNVIYKKSQVIASYDDLLRLEKVIKKGMPEHEVISEISNFKYTKYHNKSTTYEWTGKPYHGDFIRISTECSDKYTTIYWLSIYLKNKRVTKVLLGVDQIDPDSC